MSEQPATTGIDPALAAVLAQAWALLARGRTDPAHGCHWPVLATVGLDGGADARTVVLRALDPARRELAVHSDAHAGKLGQLNAEARACLVFHDAPGRTQLRARGPIRSHVADDAAARAWATLAPHSRALYAGFERFALLRMRVTDLDWLLLDPNGHRRARFHWSSAGGDDPARASAAGKHDSPSEAAWIDP
jgi:hypothetical protein